MGQVDNFSINSLSPNTHRVIYYWVAEDDGGGDD